jgi:choline dehydrogenase-like flavoprotein
MLSFSFAANLSARDEYPLGHRIVRSAQFGIWIRMIGDARLLDAEVELAAAVVIVGGGVAGIIMALELEAKGIETIVLESGGYKPDNATRDLYRGESADLPYRFADGCRSRFLGGSSNCWGGWCRPLDDWDFEKRDWIQYSGWPITATDLAPYYPRTHRFLELGPFNYDIAEFERNNNRSDVRRMPLPSGLVWDSISQFSPPTRLGRRFRAELDEAKHVKTYLHANVVDIEVGPDARDVRRLHCRTLSGRAFTVVGRLFVLSTGGIENARLLLASNKVCSEGLGNEHDLVGRFFMDHPRIDSASIHFHGEWHRNKLFDFKYHYQNRAVSAFNTQYAAALALTHETQQREQITNARVWFCSIFPGDNSGSAEALIRIKRRLERREPPETTLVGDLMTLAAHPLDTSGFIMARLYKLRPLIRDVRFQAIVEPEPDPDSRVTLLPDQKDALGLPRVRVGWRLSQLVRRTFDRNFAIIADELRRAGVAEVSLEPPLEGGSIWPDTLDPQGTWHHMGTTRMHDSPRQGVVDRTCRVHNLANLFIAGSSVFPTAGSNFPTQTIAALAIRLSDHLVETLAASNHSSVATEAHDPYPFGVGRLF